MKKRKVESLQKSNALNHNPSKVVDKLFENEFFDPYDLIQVKYEMLRSHRADKKPVHQAATSFGLSKVTFYEALHAFEQEGILGLQPKKRGPKQRRKMTPEITEFAEEKIQQDPSLRCEDLLKLIREKYGVTIHRRTLERGMNEKKRELLRKA